MLIVADELGGGSAGCKVGRTDGSTITVNAKTVIIAIGGYAASSDLVYKYSKAYLAFGIAGVGNDHLDLLGNVCEILEDEDALEQPKKTTDPSYVLAHLQ